MLSRVSAASRGVGRWMSSVRYASTLVVAQAEAEGLSGGTLATITAAKAVGGSIDVLVVGSDVSAAAKAAGGVDGVGSVFSASSEALGHGIAEHVTAATLKVHEQNSYSHIFTEGSNGGKNFLPRVAALLDVQALSDIVSVEGEKEFVRPTYAGNAMARVSVEESVVVATVRPTAFEKATLGEGGGDAVEVDVGEVVGGVEFVKEEMTSSDRPDLGGADVVVSGGRGLKNAEEFERIMNPLADKLGAAIGASRAAVDAGFCPNDMQVGQTGTVVAPSLYIAVGISGAIQHLAGMKDSDVIVAINKDEDAPIFQVADYGLVADLFDAVPELTEKL